MSKGKDSVSLAYAVLLSLLVLLPLFGLAQSLPSDITDPDRWRELLLDPLTQKQLGLSVLVALLSAGLATLIAIPIALAFSRATTGLRILLILVAMVPLAMPPFVLAATLQSAVEAHKVGLSFFNAWEQRPLLVMTYGLHYAPVVLALMILGLRRLDPGLAESARCHGIGTLSAWFHIVRPVLAPTVGIAVLVVTVWTIGESGAPLALNQSSLFPAAFTIADGQQIDLRIRTQQSFWLWLLINAVIVTAGWRFLNAIPLTVKPVHHRPRPGDSVTWLFALLVCVITAIPFAWLAIQADWSRLSSVMHLQVLGDATWDFSLMVGVTMAALALPMMFLAQSTSSPATLLRGSAGVLFMFPTLLIALGYHLLTAEWLVKDASSSVWYVAVMAMAMILPVIALIPHLRIARANFWSCGTGTPPYAWLTLRLAVSRSLALVGSLFCFGVAMGLSEIAIPQLPGIGPTLGSNLLQQIAAGATLPTWASSSIGLVTVNYLILSTGLLLLNRRFGITDGIDQPRHSAWN